MKVCGAPQLIVKTTVSLYDDHLTAGIEISAIGCVANGCLLTAKTAREPCGVHASDTTSLRFARRIGADILFAPTVFP